MKTSSALALFVVLGLAEAASPQQLVQTVAAEGSTVLTMANVHGLNVKVVIHQMLLDKQHHYYDELFWGGDVDEVPKSSVVGVDVNEDNQRIFVPMSAYADLGDLHHASLVATRNGFNLRLVGGDTAGSYTAILSFQKDCIATRIVRSAEFPDQAWEYTHYSAVSRTSSRESCGSTRRAGAAK